MLLAATDFDNLVRFTISAIVRNGFCLKHANKINAEFFVYVVFTSDNML